MRTIFYLNYEIVLLNTNIDLHINIDIHFFVTKNINCQFQSFFAANIQPILNTYQ